MREEAKSAGYMKYAAVAVVAVLAILFVPMVPVEVSYSEEEPYERPARYEVLSATIKESWDLRRGVYHIFEVVVKNVDKHGGTFSVTFYLYDVHGLFGKETVTNYIGPGVTMKFSAEFDTELGQDVKGEYTVSPPTVIDVRIVTRRRTVYRSIFELLIYG